MPKGQTPGLPGTETDPNGQWRIAAWSLAWALTFLGTSVAIKNEWMGSGLPEAVATVIVTMFGLGLVLAIRRVLRDTDEAQRKIHFDALAIAVGVAFVFGFVYSLLEAAGTVAEAEAMNVVAAMIVSYLISVAVGKAKRAEPVRRAG